jgi:hypothetical protein
MRKSWLIGLAAALVALFAFPAIASAQSGHFVTGGKNAPTCMDIGTQLQCTGKVAGLGGTTFEITLEATGTAAVDCRNHGGNVAPGQRTSVTATGTSGPLETPRNGHYEFTVTTVTPTVPDVPTCPNPNWTAEVTDVEFDSATLRLFVDDVMTDMFMVF